MTNINRVHPGVPTGGQFAASEKGAASGVALTEADPNRHPQVLAAVAKAKRTGAPVLLPDIDGVTGPAFDDGEHGGTCGDYSVGKEPSMRFTWATGNDDIPFVSATTTYWVSARSAHRDGDIVDLEADEVDEAVAARREWEDQVETSSTVPPKVPQVRFAVEEAIEWLAHTDVADPGGTEINSHYEAGEGDALTYSSLEAAERRATGLAKSERAERYSPENWKP